MNKRKLNTISTAPGAKNMFTKNVTSPADILTINFPEFALRCNIRYRRGSSNKIASTRNIQHAAPGKSLVRVGAACLMVLVVAQTRSKCRR